jgi:phenylacetate-CoA ligase
LVGGIIGRCDDMVVVRGVNIYPSAIDQIVRECGGIAEYRVEVKMIRNLAELDVTIEPDPGVEDVDGLVSKLARAFQLSLALRVPVKSVSTGSLPRFEMKAKRWVKT